MNQAAALYEWKTGNCNTRFHTFTHFLGFKRVVLNLLGEKSQELHVVRWVSNLLRNGIEMCPLETCRVSICRMI